MKTKCSISYISFLKGIELIQHRIELDILLKDIDDEEESKSIALLIQNELQILLRLTRIPKYYKSIEEDLFNFIVTGIKDGIMSSKECFERCNYSTKILLVIKSRTYVLDTIKEMFDKIYGKCIITTKTDYGTKTIVRNNFSQYYTLFNLDYCFFKGENMNSQSIIPEKMTDINDSYLNNTLEVYRNILKIFSEGTFFEILENKILPLSKFKSGNLPELDLMLLHFALLFTQIISANGRNFTGKTQNDDLNTFDVKKTVLVERKVCDSYLSVETVNSLKKLIKMILTGVDKKTEHFDGSSQINKFSVIIKEIMAINSIVMGDSLSEKRGSSDFEVTGADLNNSSNSESVNQMTTVKNKKLKEMKEKAEKASMQIKDENSDEKSKICTYCSLEIEEDDITFLYNLSEDARYSNSNINYNLKTNEENIKQSMEITLEEASNELKNDQKKRETLNFCNHLYHSNCLQKIRISAAKYRW